MLDDKMCQTQTVTTFVTLKYTDLSNLSNEDYLVTSSTAAAGNITAILITLRPDVRVGCQLHDTT